jgi:biotin-dependent carboxylase-like uncharacterized protein
MPEARLTVQSCGPLVSYQDGGRFGMLRFGVPASGPMDRLAHAAANISVGRPQIATAIEISMGGLELTCESGEVTFGIAGGDFHVLHAGAVAAPWGVRTLRAGEALSVRAGRWGSWAYLAFAGELLCRHWAGRAATHSTSGLGGGMLAAGTTVVVRDAMALDARHGDLAIPDFARPRSMIRVVLGPQLAQFGPEATDAFLRQPFTVTSAYDRMGMRLAGPSLQLGDSLSIPSEPVVRGSVQVGGDGVASILLADHQTMGGYPKIATIISADLDGVSQLQPHDRVRFQAVSPEEGLRLARVHGQSRDRYLQEVATRRITLDDRLMRENLISGIATHGEPRHH